MLGVDVKEGHTNKELATLLLDNGLLLPHRRAERLRLLPPAGHHQGRNGQGSGHHEADPARLSPRKTVEKGNKPP